MSRPARRTGKALKQALGARLTTWGSGPSSARQADRSLFLAFRSAAAGLQKPAGMKILFIGDVVGSPGRKIVHERLADILAQRRIDFCIVNCENAASGFGVTPKIAEELFAAGADVLTS